MSKSLLKFASDRQLETYIWCSVLLVIPVGNVDTELNGEQYTVSE